jgi:hypothetical protein
MPDSVIPDFWRYDGLHDTAHLKQYLQENPQLWGIHTQRQEQAGTPHDDTKAIFIRGPTEFTAESYQGTVEACDFPIPDELRDAVYKILSPVFEEIGVKEVGYILLTKLSAYGHIKPHIDEGVYSDYYTRFHIPIQTNKDNIFHCYKSSVNMKEGEMWDFNHKDIHSFANNSNEDRIHLIFDGV